MTKKDRTAFNAILILSGKKNICEDCRHSKNSINYVSWNTQILQYSCTKKNKIVLPFSSCNKFTL